MFIEIVFSIFSFILPLFLVKILVIWLTFQVLQIKESWLWEGKFKMESFVPPGFRSNATFRNRMTSARIDVLSPKWGMENRSSNAFFFFKFVVMCDYDDLNRVNLRGKSPVNSTLLIKMQTNSGVMDGKNQDRVTFPSPRIIQVNNLQHSPWKSGAIFALMGHCSWPKMWPWWPQTKYRSHHTRVSLNRKNNGKIEDIFNVIKQLM